MRIAGLIGGIGPESTIDYYRLLVNTWQRRRGDESYPSVVINCVDLQRMVGMVSSGDFAALAAFLTAEVERLRDADVAFAAIAANTPHVVFDEVERASPIPLISIVRVTCQAARRSGLRRLALLGTRFTMTGSFYPAVFDAENVALVVPRPEEQAWVHDKYMNELVKGEFADETRDRMLQLIVRLRDEEQVEGVILAGTELPLLLRDCDVNGLQMIDTTRVHVEAIVERMLE